MSPLLLVALIASAILAVVLIVTSVRQSAGSSQVWSAEHGHYHDASGREIPR